MKVPRRRYRSSATPKQVPFPRKSTVELRLRTGPSDQVISKKTFDKVEPKKTKAFLRSSFQPRRRLTAQEKQELVELFCWVLVAVALFIFFLHVINPR